MTATGNPNVIIPPGVTPGGERVVRHIEGVGELVFENYGPGQWLTKAGTVAKKARRAYLLDGREIDAVSSLVGTMDKPALLRWIETQATIGAVQADRLGELAGVPEGDWAYRVRSLGLGASAKRDEGAERGTVTHDALHALARGESAPNPSEYPAIARPWLRAAVGAFLALGITEVVEAEQPVCHPELGYAGRPDLLAVADGKLTLVDYKTGKGKAYPEVHWQKRLYAMAIERSLGLKVERLVAVAIGDDGGFELIECAASDADCLALIAVYRARKRIEQDMRAQRAVTKAAAA